jgi:hypothetical protein
MTIKAHLAELEQQHKTLEHEIAEALAHSSTDDLKITELKRRKLLLKDEIERVRHGEVLNLLGNWRGASFAVIHQTGFGEPSKGAPHGSEITCFAADP